MTAKPETNSKIFALRAAQWVGCTGAHKHDGKWMPCETHEELERISNAAEPDKKSGYQEMNERYFKRRAKGKNKKKGWEKLRETKPLGGFATLEGGGIVSAPINSTIYSGGVKSYIPGISPRDNDPDVFTDIESARKRSRMLGCIGVRRMPSATGRTVWLPCTNNSDYARLAGTTFLGRRNQRESQNRMIRTIIRRELRNSSKNKLRNKSLFEEIYGIKGLGRAIGRALTPNVSSRGLRQSLQRIEGVLDPFKRRDMDGDGMIFDGTWREMVAPTRSGLSSETEGTDAVKPRWSSPVRNNWFTPNKIGKGGVLKAQEILNFDRLRLRKNRDEQASVLGVTREVIDAMHEPDASIDAFDADRLVMSALNLHPMLIFGDAWLIADKTPSKPKTRNIGKLDDRDNRILEIRSNGGKVQDIADELKVSKQRASQLLRRALERNERDLDSRGLSSRTDVDTYIQTYSELDNVVAEMPNPEDYLDVNNLPQSVIRFDAAQKEWEKNNPRLSARYKKLLDFLDKQLDAFEEDADDEMSKIIKKIKNQRQRGLVTNNEAHGHISDVLARRQSRRGLSSSTANPTKRTYTKSKIPKVGPFKESDYPLEVQLAIVEDYKNPEKTLSYIAKKHNVTIEYVLFLARQYNQPYRINNPKSARRQRIIEAIRNGMPLEEVTEKFNIPSAQLSKLKGISESAKARKLRLAGEKARRQKKEEKIIKLFNDGLGVTAIARLTKMEISTVADVLLANEETKPKLIAKRDGSQNSSLILLPQVRELFKNGLNIAQIGKTLRKDIKLIRQIVNEDDELSKLHRERKAKKFFLAQKKGEELREFFINGGSMKDAIEKFNLSRQQIKRWRGRQATKSKKQPGIPRLPRLPDDGRGGARTRGLSSSTANPMKRGDGMIQRDERGNPIRQADRRKETVENSIAKLKKLGLSDEEINLLFTGNKATPVDPKTPDIDTNAKPRKGGLNSMSLSEMAKSSPSTWPEKQKIHFIDWANSKPSFNVPYALAQKFKRDGDLTDVEWQRILNFYSKYGPEKRGLSSSTTPNATNFSNVGARRMGQIILERVRQDRRNKKPGTRVHYHVVGPGAVGKSTLTDYLVKNGLMPSNTDAAHVDPDFIKQGIMGYDGGKGSVSVHRESARSATKTVESAAKEGMDIVTEGTGYRLYEYKTTSDPNYKKIVHIPFLPYDKAEARLAARNAQGGRQLPIDQIRFKGQQLYGWLTNHLNKNEIQDMYIWDMDVPQGAAPRVVAKIEDGVFRAIDEPAFKRWSEQSGGGRGGDSNLSWFKRNFPQK